MDKGNLTKFATRLANESKQEEEKARDSGASLGCEWARRIARPSELRRMENTEVDTSSWFALCHGYSSIEDYFGSSGRDLSDEHSRLVEDEELAQDFCEGFVEGAMAAWEEVRTALSAEGQTSAQQG